MPPGTLHFTLPPRSWRDHGFRQNEGPYDSEKEVKRGFKSPAKITARPLICWREETGERLSSKPQISQAGILPSPRLASARLSSPNTYSCSPLAGSLGPALTHQETTQGQPGQPWQHHTARQLWSRGSQAKLQPCFPLQGSFWPFPLPLPKSKPSPSALLAPAWPLRFVTSKFCSLAPGLEITQIRFSPRCKEATPGLCNARVPRSNKHWFVRRASSGKPGYENTCNPHRTQRDSRIHLLIELCDHWEALKSSAFDTVSKDFSNVPPLWQVSKLSLLHCLTPSPSQGRLCRKHHRLQHFPGTRAQWHSWSFKMVLGSLENSHISCRSTFPSTNSVRVQTESVGQWCSAIMKAQRQHISAKKSYFPF